MHSRQRGSLLQCWLGRITREVRTCGYLSLYAMLRSAQYDSLIFATFSHLREHDRLACVTWRGGHYTPLLLVSFHLFGFAHICYKLQAGPWVFLDNRYGCCCVDINLGFLGSAARAAIIQRAPRCLPSWRTSKPHQRQVLSVQDGTRQAMAPNRRLSSCDDLLLLSLDLSYRIRSNRVTGTAELHQAAIESINLLAIPHINVPG